MITESFTADYHADILNRLNEYLNNNSPHRLISVQQLECFKHSLNTLKIPD